MPLSHEDLSGTRPLEVTFTCELFQPTSGLHINGVEVLQVDNSTDKTTTILARYRDCMTLLLTDKTADDTNASTNADAQAIKAGDMVKAIIDRIKVTEGSRIIRATGRLAE
jgi:hypothetical protein